MQEKDPRKLGSGHGFGWAMARDDRELSADNEEEITLVKALKCKPTGADGVQQVGNLFINLRKLRKKYRLWVSPKQIIFDHW